MYDHRLAPDERDDCREPGFRFARVHLPKKTTTIVGKHFLSRTQFLEALAQWKRPGATQTGEPEWMYYEVRQ